ncbi:unnamed protein product, partial [Closterium sp. NIES-54]
MADAYLYAHLVDGESRAVVYLYVNFDSATTTIQATYKIFAALPVAPPVYITLAGTTVPGCDPLRCSLPPGNPTWVQPVPSVWQAIGTFTSTPATDPERYGALLQLIDNSLVFPGVVMVYKDAQGAMRPVMGQLRADSMRKILEVGPIPAYVPSPQYVVRFLSYMPGGANISLSQSADGLSFQASFALAVVVPSEEPISVFLNVNLLDALPPPPLPPAGGCVAKKEKGNNKDKSKVKGKDKPKCNKGKGKGKKGGDDDECCDDDGDTLPPPPPTTPNVTSTRALLYSNNSPCDLNCTSVIVLHGTQSWSFAGLTPKALAASDGYNALVALMQYAATGVKGRLVNATMKLAAIDQPNGPNDLLQRVYSQRDEAAKSSNAVATAAPEGRDRPADVAVAHEAEADVAAVSEQDGRDRTAAVRVSASASESGRGSDRAAAAPPPAAIAAAQESQAAAAAAVAVPTLVALVAVALVLCNADRVIMSVAILPLSASNGWPPSVAGIVQSSFLWGYLITPIIGGSLADRYGGRPVLAAGLALWSLATLLTPTAAAHSLGALLTVRAVMGLGEGVALPCMNHMVSRYVPENRRAWAVGICFAGFHVGSMLGLLSAPSLMALPGLGLTGPFLLFGALGLLWLALWLLLVPGDASGASVAPSASAASAASGADIGGQLEGKQKMQGGVGASGSRVTVWQLLSHPASWAIIIANAVNNWGYFILLSWMPLYFNQVLHTDIRQAAWFSAGPWAVMAGIGMLAAELANRMEGRQGMTRTAVRKIMQTAGFLGPAASLLLLTRMTTAPLAALCLTAALGLSAFSQAGWLLNHKDIAPRHVGLLH